MLKNLDNKKKIETELKDIGVLKATELVARVRKDLSEMISSVQALRAPKVMVQQFLERAIEEVMNITGTIFSKVCYELRSSIVESYRENDELSDSMITAIFQKAALNFMEDMKKMRDDQMKAAIEVLRDLEKII